MNERSLGIVIADDQPLFASGIGMLIDAQPDMSCVGVATNGHEVIDMAEQRRPQVILMDLRMPVMNGLDATRSILQRHLVRQHRDPPRIVVLTTIRKDEAVFQALRAGASAFLTKDATPDVLLQTIRSSHAGDTASERNATYEVIQEFAESPTLRPSVLSELTSREREIFHLIARGLSNAEISQEVYLSDATVKSHVRAVLHKLKLRSRVQVVILAYENNLTR